MDFRKIFLETCDDLKLNMNSKLRDMNNFKVSSLDVVKTLKSYSIHRSVFNACYKEGEIKTLRLLSFVFGSFNIMKFNEHKDLSLVCPIFYVTVNHNQLERGDLVLPICKLASVESGEEDQNFQVFVPIDHDDQDEGTVSLGDLFPLDPKVFPEERLAGFSLTTCKGNNFVSVKAGHGLNVGDYLVVHGKFYKITEIHPEDGFAYGMEDSRNMIYVESPFENNVTKRAFRFRKNFSIRGKLLTLPSSKMHRFRGVSVKFTENKNKQKCGEVGVSFSCAVFNSIPRRS